ncbi:MAG TPA: YbaK/EbsC family protein [Anaerolineae bacterium]|nr:YbaK/EbsC family protein [Anaerolineae bacterium]
MGERERLSGVDRVRECLRKLGLEIQVLRSPEGTATASEAAAAAGCELGAIVKSLLFLVDDAPVLVLVAGDRKADPRKLGRLFGVSKKRVRIADAETVERVTGYPVGGVPPVGHLTSLPVIVDQTLERFETVWASAGAPDAIFPIDTRLLIEITGGRVEDVVKMGLQEFLDHLLEAS